MRLRFRYVLVFIFWATCSFAQDKGLPIRQAETVDSLILYNYIPEAEAQAGNFLAALSKDKGDDNIGLRLKLMNCRADIHLIKEEYTKSLKLALETIDLAKKYFHPEQEFRASLIASLIYEINEDPLLSKSYLDKAQQLYVDYGLENVYSTYCVRVSSFYRFNNQKDSAIFFAYKALDFAKRYHNRKDISDGYLLLNILLDDEEEAIAYGLKAASSFIEINHIASAASMYNNITRIYLNRNDIDKALFYNDSSFSMAASYKVTDIYYSFFFRNRADIFESLKNKDSALVYYKKFHKYYTKSVKEQDVAELKNITEQYQNDKKEAVIKSKDQQMIFIISLLAVIAIASILVIMKNRKISFQNKIITKQVDELVKTLAQKQMLLSELQHRVKNNLQHVISILEIQKESVDFNNIDELIRGNQNRIHSMALLHKKLSVSDNVNEVDLQRYTLELSDLVISSYDSFKKEITVDVLCEVEKIAIEKALPIGLILVELISNSIKHAFKGKQNGVINITIERDEQTRKMKVHYADSGAGFDFNKTCNTGLGLEIIKGLIDQLDGTVELKNNNGFELIISFLN